ncbi:Uncharacterized [Syntrophomonas zehnderi OL-4]|uniref:Uncharacterized n=1 Tax=Syntrophomonas zehnderi OL-4 TaxID=690567 RepID=A0A0E3W2H3_9FIRM|nr:hypothetical protein [Syntrophomonas zehnderi]CFX00341.1 Uncharacterized [Syntrophomonas zehnderi OL-4]
MLFGNKNNLSLILVLLIIVLATLGLSRNSSLPRQLWQNFFRFMVGQETKLSTAQLNELKTEHYTVKFSERDSDYVHLVADTAETAYDLVSREMNWQTGQKTTIIIYPDSQSLAKSFGWDKDDKAMGVYWGGTIRILSPREWLKQPYDQEEFLKNGPMVHEFVHLMVDEKTRGNYNRWWTEGVAQYVEKKLTGFEFKTSAAGQPDSMYTLEELAKNFDRLNQQAAYWESLKAVEYIAEKYGEESIYVIMDYLGKGYTMEKACEMATGTDFKNFAYQCYQYMEKQ